MSDTYLQDSLEYTDPQSKKLSFCKASPNHLSDWVKNLPKLGSQTLSGALHNALVELSRIKMAPPKYLECLELMMPLLVDVNQQLSLRYLVKSAKLNDEHIKAAEIANSVNNLAIKCYNRMIVEGLKSEEEYATAIGRSMEWIMQLAVRCYSLYLPLPQNLWRQLNALYTFVERSDWQTHTFKPRFGSNQKSATLQNIYLQNVLLACAQPLQLEQKQISNLLEALPKLADLATITPSSREKNCLFTVNLSDQSQPHYYRKRDQSHSVQYRFFIVENIIETIISPSRKSNFSSQLGPDLTMHLEQIWQKVPVRSHKRLESKASVECTVGITQAFLSLTEGLTPSNFMDQYHHELYEDPVNPISIAQSHSSANINNIKSIVVNHSESGFCLKFASIPDRIESGDLISLIHPYLHKRVYTVIRWIQLLDRKSCKIGVALVSTNAEPCVIQIINAQGEPFSARPALLIDSIEESPGTPTLSLPQHWCSKLQSNSNFSARSCDCLRTKT